MRLKRLIKNSKIHIVIDFPTKEAVLTGVPFGKKTEFVKILSEVGIDYDSCSVSFAIGEHPKDGDIYNFCVPKKEAADSIYPQFSVGKYINPQLADKYFSELYSDIEETSPNIILAAGSLSTAALLHKTNISAIRGTLFPFADCKVLPTHSPNMLNKNWTLRPIITADCIKLKREAETKALVYDSIDVGIYPTLQDLADFYEQAKSASIISYDIETLPSKGQITCIGFAIDNFAICVPFVSFASADNSYWKTQQDEITAWNFVKAILKLNCPKVTQNGMYDMTWLFKKLGIAQNGDNFDTMLLHHSCFPEMQKSLDFLGSIYTNLPSWKNTFRKREDNKKDA